MTFSFFQLFSNSSRFLSFSSMFVIYIGFYLKFAYRTTFFCVSFHFFGQIAPIFAFILFSTFQFLAYGFPIKVRFQSVGHGVKFHRVLSFIHQHVWWVTVFNWSSTLVQWLSPVRVTNQTKLGLHPVWNNETDWCRTGGSAMLPPSSRFSFFTKPQVVAVISAPFFTIVFAKRR